MSRLGYVPALDGLRAVAISLVVSSHAFGWPEGGWLGVDLFFVLSGFLITTLLLERRGSYSIRDFYWRRGLRLLPALIVLLAVAYAVDRSLFGTFAGLGYISNVVIAGGGGEHLPASLTHLWSLAAEEQFYLLWPLALFAAISLGNRVAFTVAAAGAIASTAFAFLLFVDGASSSRLFFAPDTRAASIFVGCAFALALSLRTLSLVRLEIPALAAVITLVLFLGDVRMSLSGPPLLLFALASAVLIVRAMQGGRLASALEFAPFVFVGRVSYSLYLWHWPLLVWFGVAGGAELLDVPVIALLFLLAIGSHYVVERPFLRLKNRGRDMTRPGVASGHTLERLRPGWARN